MALLEVRCNKCGRILQADPNSADPLVCAHCQNVIPRSAAFPKPKAGGQRGPARPAVPAAAAGPARPMPRVMVNGAVGMPAPQVQVRQAVAQTAPQAAGNPQDIEDDEPSAIQAAFSEAFPWALSVAFHLGALLLLTFFTTFASVRTKAPRTAEEDFVPPDEQKIPTNLVGDSDTPGARVLTDFEGIEAYGKGPISHDVMNAGDLSAAGTDGGGKNGEFSSIGIVVPGAGAAGGGSGDGSGIGSKLGANLGGTGGGRGGRFFGTGLPKKGCYKIVYMVDCSGSMTANFDYVKAELKHSISEMIARQQFAILMFSDGPPKEFKVKGQSGMVNATKENVKLANDFIDGVVAASETGKTCPQDTFQRTFNMKPELVYVLTDGVFDGPDVPAQVRGLNKDHKVMINTFLFCEHDKEGEKMLKTIAADNGGNYKFLDEKDLGKEYK